MDSRLNRSVKEKGSLEQYIRYLWLDKGTICDLEYLHVIPTQLNARKPAIIETQKIERLTGPEINSLGSRECNKRL